MDKSFDSCHFVIGIKYKARKFTCETTYFILSLSRLPDRINRGCLFIYNTKIGENKNNGNKTPEYTSNYIKTDATICILATEHVQPDKNIQRRISRGYKKTIPSTDVIHLTNTHTHTVLAKTNKKLKTIS